MLFRILLLVLIIPFASIGQVEQKPSKKKVKISGTLQYTSFHQGGAQNPYKPIPRALCNYKLYVVKIVHQDRIPIVVDSIQSDAEGNFKIKLPPGNYGFVTKADLDSLDAGQYLPRGLYSENSFNNDFMGETSSSYWEISTSSAIIVGDSDFGGIIITNHRSTICGMCP